MASWPQPPPQGQETVPHGVRLAFSSQILRWRPAVDAREEPEQRSRGPERPIGRVPSGSQVAHLQRIRDAPVLGPAAHVLRVADEGLRLVHAPMLHRGRAGGTFGLSWRQTRAGVAKLADARDLKSRDSPRVVRVRSPPPAILNSDNNGTSRLGGGERSCPEPLEPSCPAFSHTGDRRVIPWTIQDAEPAVGAHGFLVWARRSSRGCSSRAATQMPRSATMSFPYRQPPSLGPRRSRSRASREEASRWSGGGRWAPRRGREPRQ